MSDHVNEWLGTYLDNELSGNRLRQVESHLNSCQLCRSELEALRTLSKLIKESDLTENMFPAERFAAQVILRLPRQKTITRPLNSLATRGLLVPVGALIAWSFFQTVFLISWLASAGAQFGLFGNLSASIAPASPPALWSSALTGLFHNSLSQGGQTMLQVLEWTEALGRGFWGSLGWQISIALIYWGGLIVWWRRQHKASSGLTE